MSEDKKTIQEALAEVQRKVNEERAKLVAEMYASLDEAMPKVTVSGKPMQTKGVVPKNKAQDYLANKEGTKIPPAENQNLPGSPPKLPKPATVSDLTKSSGSTAKTLAKVGGAASVAGSAGLGAAAVGGMASGGLGYLATQTQTGKDIGKWIGDNVPGAKTAADVMRKTGEAIGVREPSQAKPAATAKPTELPKIDVPAKQTTPAPSQAKKTEPSSFGAAFKAAREKATEMGKPSTGQFEYKGKEYQTNIKGEKYVPMSQQTKVSTSSTTAPKPDTSTTVPLPPKRPEGLGTTSNGKQTLPSVDVGKPSSGPEFPKNKTSGTPTPPSRPETMDSKTKNWIATDRIGVPGNTVKMNYPTSPVNVSRGLERNNQSDNPKVPQVAPEPKPLDLNKPESESGGKKKKMSEETNPLIAAFLKLQSENPSNMFEAAKKLSPKQKEKMDVDKDNDIDADDLSALRAGKKKMEEGSLPSMAKPSANADTKSVTTDFSAPDRPAVSMDNKPVVSPTAPKVDTTVPASDKKALDSKFKSIAREEVEFSQAEIDHINSFFLEASVAPNRPEVAIGADSTSDKMSQNDVTGTAESGKRKIKEETDSADETNMAKTQLKAMASKAKNLHSKLKTSKNLPAWVQSKLAVAKDGVTSVDDYMTHSGKIKEEIELDEGDLSLRTLYNNWADHASGYNNQSRTKAAAVEKSITKVHGQNVMHHLKNALNANLEGDSDKEESHFEKARTAAGNSDRIGATVGRGRSEFRKTNEETLDEHKSMEGETLKPGDQVGYKEGHEKYGHIHSISPEGHAKIKVWNDNTGDYHHVTKHVSKLWKEGTNEETISEGRPKKNPTPETTERDPRKHIQVEAGRAAAGNVVDFHHNDGSKSKITPAMGRRITSHLNSLKPADRQSAVNKMHDSAEGLKV